MAVDDLYELCHIVILSRNTVAICVAGGHDACGINFEIPVLRGFTFCRPVGVSTLEEL
jgi:hypothetical protein